jgi:hypothetical protein
VSLDAGNPLAVWAARRWFHLPYFHAAMRVGTSGPRVHYRSQRLASATRVDFRAVYWPTTAAAQAKVGTLEHFLTERYCLYATAADGRILRADVHHPPWPLQSAAAEIEENTVGSGQGITLDGPPALLHFARTIDVVVWGATVVS